MFVDGLLMSIVSLFNARVTSLKAYMHSENTVFMHIMNILMCLLFEKRKKRNGKDEKKIEETIEKEDKISSIEF